MTQQQILQLQQFLRLAQNDIKSYRVNRDHAAHRVMHYSVGRVMGAYSMLGDTCKDSDVHARVQTLMDDFTDVSLLTPR